MKKIIIATLLLTSTLISGCGAFNTKSSEKQPVVLEESEYADLSEDLFKYEIKLDGVKYTLPVDFAELNNNGWVLSDKDSDETIGKNLYLTSKIKLTKDDEKVSTQFMNNGSGKSTKLPDCQVGELSIYPEDKVSIILSKGITIGSSIDDLEAAYGYPDEKEPYKDSSLKDCEIYEYYNPDGDKSILSSYWIGVNHKTNLVTSIMINNLVVQDEH